MSEKLRERLETLLALVGKATPGPWRWSLNGNIVPEPYTDDYEIAAVYSEHMDDACPDNAAAIIAALNFLRDHGQALAELARRVEDAPVGRLDIGRDDFDDADMVEIVMDPNHVSHLQHQRVRIVPEAGLGGGDA